MMTTIRALALAAVAFSTAASAGQMTVFSDNFNRPAATAVVGNGWAETCTAALCGNVANITDHATIVAGGASGLAGDFALKLLGQNSGALDGVAIENSISTLGFFGPVTISFDYKSSNNTTDNGAFNLVVKDKVGTTTAAFTTLATYGLKTGGTNWHHVDLALSGASNTNELSIAFMDNTFQDNYYVMIDNVTVTAVPEPGTVALFGLALAGLTVARRRKI